MHWYRTNRRFSGALALFALALQITLAFGHIHLRDFAGVPGVVAAATHADAQQPAGPNDADHSTHDYCLVCATVSLAGTLVVPDLAALPVPLHSTQAQPWHSCTAACGRRDHALFRARAPPLA
jgi:hypothetical protein